LTGFFAGEVHTLHDPPEVQFLQYLQLEQAVQVPVGEQVPEQQILSSENEVMLKNRKAIRSRFLRTIGFERLIFLQYKHSGVIA